MWRYKDLSQALLPGGDISQIKVVSTYSFLTSSYSMSSYIGKWVKNLKFSSKSNSMPLLAFSLFLPLCFCHTSSRLIKIQPALKATLHSDSSCCVDEPRECRASYALSREGQPWDNISVRVGVRVSTTPRSSPRRPNANQLVVDLAVPQ